MDVNKYIVAGLVGLFLIYAAYESGHDAREEVVHTPVVPDWAAIAAWPEIDASEVYARPNPNRRNTVIVLDDSGSMSSDIRAAKRAIIHALGAMNDSDRVAVTALNYGTVLDFTSVRDAKSTLPPALERVNSDGGTPLTGAIANAKALLEKEASSARGFGTFRLIVTTDGAADDGGALAASIEDLAATTPIQLTTIGIDISDRHVLSRSDLGTFVDVANVAALESALQAAVAENADFTAITEFEANEG